jgi:TPR repeat protein
MNPIGKRETCQGSSASDQDMVLALRYARGDGVPKNPDLALKLFEKSAKRGNCNAMFQAGLQYKLGIGCTQKNPTKSFDYFHQAAEKGHLGALVTLGNTYMSDERDEKTKMTGWSYLKKASDLGCPEAMYIIASRLEVGLGVSLDQQEAIRYYQMAADKWHLKAICEIGNRFLRGNGLKVDHQKAAHYFQMGSILNDSFSQSELSNLYEHGIGVVQDLAKAQSLKNRLHQNSH